MKTAFITGVTGQDGSYLSEMLLDFGYEVHGLVRPNNSADRFLLLERMRKQGVILHTADITDGASLTEILATVDPSEIYHLAAQSHVGLSFDLPEYTHRVNAEGTAALFMAISRAGLSKTKIYSALTSEIFGNAPAPQDETTPLEPRSPYGISKLSAYYTTLNAQERGMFAVNGILFNHTSPRRGYQFVTRKIVGQLAEIVAGEREMFSLGNLSAKRDFGYSPEYVYGMWQLLQQEIYCGRGGGLVLGTGDTHSIAEFLACACKYVGIAHYKPLIDIDISMVRPTEVNCLQADTSLARETFGWTTFVKFHDLVKIMVDAEFRLKGLETPKEGFEKLRRLSKTTAGMAWIVGAEGL